MSRWSVLIWCVACPLAAVTAAPPGAACPDTLLVVGAAGEDRFAARFQEWAKQWQALTAKAGLSGQVIGLDLSPPHSDLEQLRSWCERASRSEGTEPLWLVLIGHGTFDGRTAKFSLRGPDLSAEQLAAWLKPIRRPLVLVNTASCSGPFLQTVAGPGRVTITATRHGSEQSSTRFAGYFLKALGGLEADLDGDGQVSVLEAFIDASRGVELSYRQEGLLPTEHALIDDNGDGRGSRGAGFSGVEPLHPDTLDGTWARQITLIPGEAERLLSSAVREERNRLERDLAALKRRRQELGEDHYFNELEKVLLKIGRLYARTPEPR